MSQLSGRQEILLRMHEFYRKEARHQREMIWETVKWTTLILTGMYGLCANYLTKFISNFEQASNGYISLAFILMSLITCAVCISLLNSFYKSNMRYISMYVKVEDELDFDERKKNETDRYVFSQDKWITFQKFRDVRQELKTADEFVKTKHKYSSAILYQYMFCAMLCFMVIDIIGIIYIIYLLK